MFLSLLLFSKTRVFLFNWCAWFLHLKHPGEEQALLTCPSHVPRSSLANMELSVSSPDPQPTNSGMKSSQAAGAPSSASGELAKLLNEVRFIAEHFEKKNADVAVCSDWKFAALVIDRLCLVAFSVLTVLCTIGLLMLAPRFV